MEGKKDKKRRKGRMLGCHKEPLEHSEERDRQTLQLKSSSWWCGWLRKAKV